jgi:hypothetical protein
MDFFQELTRGVHFSKRKHDELQLFDQAQPVL